MEEQKLKEWQSRNAILQKAYNDYYFASKQREKDSALNQIQRILEWPPFMNLCEDYTACVTGISRYGLDYNSEKCIGLIDKIAKDEMDYNF
jgi:hypothetical protein